MNVENESSPLVRDGDPFAVVCRVLSQLENACSSYSDSSFIKELFPKIIEEDLSGDLFVDELLDRAESLDPSKKINAVEFILGAMTLSGVYCNEAVKAIRLEKNNEAWSFVCDAKYWLGFVLGADSMMPHLIDGSKILARQGGQARKARFDPMRELAIKLALENKFPSKRNAAKNIAPHVLKLSEELKVRLSPDQVQDTISGWLKDVPFASKRDM